MKQVLSYTDLQKNERKNLANLVPMDMPFALYFDPTNYCNFKCLYCPQSFNDFHDSVGGSKHLDLALFDKVALELKGWGKLKVLRLYYLGEPFMHPNFFGILRIAISYNIAERIEITTNASMLNQRRIKDLLDACEHCECVIYLRVSIYSVIQEKHKKITQSPISIETIRTNMKNLRETRDSRGLNSPFIYVKMINPYCEEETNLFYEYYKAIADQIVLEEPMNWNGNHGSSIIEKLYTSEQIITMPENPARKACPYPFYTMAIFSDGDVVSCCVDWSRATKIGNVQEQTLKKIWKSKQLKDFQIAHLSGKRFSHIACQNCQVLNCCPELDNIDDLPLNRIL